MADFGGGDLNAFRDEVKAWLDEASTDEGLIPNS